ncbi:M10 family metallopeptidase C-terminal domain-containing protein [Ruegeria marina]|uniref:Type I secretion C-terminal target domain (VC_A0849 subclass) n=1 Tax=Ruegeria marina TaxID=639004 RepID=A0A1G6YVA4_9RHOB|nr:hypothetical protein [Ruegeria marina]SDD94329.1 type I secretion C-terminal target domain (VC_A0849 subclass) [Ruegeria marina]
MATFIEIAGFSSGPFADDTFDSADTGDNFLIGDAGNTLLGPGTGGNDTLSISASSSGTNVIAGDSSNLASGATGGNDSLTGGDNAERNEMYGDAYNMQAFSTGGNDLLIAGDGAFTNEMYGDAYFGNFQSVGGNDTLISGTGNDLLVGDFMFQFGALTGSDIFVFRPDNGQDQIVDFERGKDKIDLSELVIIDLSIPKKGLDRHPEKALDALLARHSQSLSFDDLDSNGSGVLDDGDDFVSVADGQTTIDLGAALGGAVGENTVEILDVTGLTVDDFIF